MARPEGPIDFTVEEVGRLAAYLRELRDLAGKTYEEMAEETLCSVSSLKRATKGGSKVPTWNTVSDFVSATSGDEKAARVLFDQAEQAAAEARRDAKRASIVPKPQFVRDVGDLSGAMRDAYSRAGRPSVREMEMLAGWRLPHSTAHEIVKGRAVPYDIRTYIAFLEACEIQGEHLYPWFESWLKVRGERVATVMKALLNQAAGLRPAETLFVNWYTEKTKKISAPTPDLVLVPAPDLYVVHGQHRVSALLETLTADELMDIAAQKLYEGGGLSSAA